MSSEFSETLLSAVRELIAASNPGLVSKEDLTRLEARVDELHDLVDEIEARLEDRAAKQDVSEPQP